MYKKRLDLCLEHLVAKNHLSGSVADEVKQDFLRLSDLSSTKAVIANYRRQDTRLDKASMDVIKIFPLELSNFALFVKKLLILSHGNATKQKLREKRKEKEIQHR